MLVTTWGKMGQVGDKWDSHKGELGQYWRTGTHYYTFITNATDNNFLKSKITNQSPKQL